MSAKPFLIGSEPLTSAQTAAVCNPFTGETIAQVCVADQAQVEKAVAVADDAFAVARRQTAFEHDLVPKLLADVRIKMISFTGSADVGWKLKTQSDKKRVTLELGGNAAVIVHEDARWRERIGLLAAGAFGYAGQSCISIQRIF